MRHGRGSSPRPDSAMGFASARRFGRCGTKSRCDDRTLFETEDCKLGHRPGGLSKEHGRVRSTQSTNSTGDVE